MRKPTNNPITLPFGATTAPYSPASPHLGTDFAYTPDDTIYAPASGTVTLIPNNGNDGNGIYMTVGGVFMGFLHTSRYLVSNTQFVETGQPIGIMGDTGYAIGKHLHWAAKVNNKFIDPMSLVTEEESEVKWNNGDTYNLLFHSIGIDVAEKAKAANYEGYFGLQDGMEFSKAMYDIINSLQYGQMVQAAQAGKDVKPYSGPTLFVKE